MKATNALMVAMTLVVSASAHAADLPTAKPAPAPAPPPPSCFASFYDYLNSSAQACPLSYMGITVYGQIDVGAGYSTHASRFNGAYAQAVGELVAKTSNGPRFQWVPDALSQSNIGIKGKETFAPGWSFVFDIDTAFDPYSLELANGPRSQVENNDKPLAAQSANTDSSRAGQWANTRAYAGVSTDSFGTLTAGRETTFSNDAAYTYDAMAASYAFSLIGNSSTYVSGVGDTEVARYNTSVKYQITYDNVRAGALWQFGGYEQGDGSDGAYQFDLGGDYKGFSFDAIYSYARDAVSLSTYSFGSALPKNFTQDDLKATLADISGAILAGDYTWGPVKLFGGYEYARFMPPSEKYAGGFTSLGDYNVLPGAVTTTAYNNNKILQVAWTGVKYAITSDLDISGAYYWAGQNNYSPAKTKCGPNKTPAIPGAAPQGAAAATCAGTISAVSGLIDWRPYPRLDVYAGAMFSAVTGGLANGYIHSTNIDPTIGLRLTF